MFVYILSKRKMVLLHNSFQVAFFFVGGDIWLSICFKWIFLIKLRAYLIHKTFCIVKGPDVEKHCRTARTTKMPLSPNIYCERSNGCLQAERVSHRTRRCTLKCVDLPLQNMSKECSGVWKAILSKAAKIKTQGTNIKLAKPGVSFLCS